MELRPAFVTDLNRRKFLRNAFMGGVGVVGAGGAGKLFADDTVTFPFENGERPLIQYPQKKPLIRITSRPPQLETPFSIFNEGAITPNEAFFVRYHLAPSPPEVDIEKFRLGIGGMVKTPLSFSLAELKTRFDPVEIVAVNQCSGNSRGFFLPRVPGGQMGNGAMGNAKWKGARLKDVLAKATLAAGAKQVTFDGLDKPLLPSIPDFVKALDVDQAIDPDVLLAYEMNGEELPVLNGYPLRLVVPGCYGTYWVKHLHEINVVGETFNGYWMNPGYRIPDNDCACVVPGTIPQKTVPIARFNVRSFITSLAGGAKLQRGRETSIQGIAFDGGYGIKTVLLSEDGGRAWREAELGPDLGKYSFRRWQIPFTPRKAGAFELMVRATNRIGQSQPFEALWNPAGYMRNVVERVIVSVT